MNKLRLACFIVPIFMLCGCHKNVKDIQNSSSIDSVFERANTQYKYLADLLPNDRFPRSFEDNKLIASKSNDWCSGFYPGCLLYTFEYTKDSVLLIDAEKSLKVLEQEKTNKATHDLGFMMFCSFGNAYKITGNEAYKNVVKESAYSLASRFDSVVGCIRSWDFSTWNSKWQYPVIIDNMMNLEMLMWAGKEFADSTLTKIAISHANKTMQNHFRDDYSSYHVVSYDTITGAVEKKTTFQGYADESAWARGQGWGLYGFTMMYRFTKDQKYLNHAKGIANYILNNPNMPKDMIPYWDFNAPDIPTAKRDASAAAVMASAFLELKDYVSKEDALRYTEAAKKMLSSLSSQQYLAEKETNNGFLLKHSVGHFPKNSEIDTPLIYADYYFLEALLKLKKDEAKSY
ncbi:glycoside hydrolase family 88 protein [Yeosuana marina]|uniref:glycoside hydrolase family 88 protein n=1 Tax=Yeosuana marina TaxID=1565536 RepID=UPI0030C8C8AA